MCSKMIESKSLGERPYEWTALPALVLAQISFKLKTFDMICVVWASCYYLLLGRTRSRAIYCLIIETREAVQSTGNSMGLTLEENMVDGLFFCATPTGPRKGHNPFVQAGAEMPDTGAKAVMPNPRCSWKGHSRWVLMSVSHVIKEVTKRSESTWYKKVKQNNSNKIQKGKSMPMYREVRWATGMVKDVTEKRGTKNNIMEIWQAYEMKIHRNTGKTAVLFYIVFQINKEREISKFQQYQAMFSDKYTSKKADPETFSISVNDFLHKNKPCLICMDLCNIIKVVMKVFKYFTLLKVYMNWATGNLDKSGIFKTLCLEQSIVFSSWHNWGFLELYSGI